MTQRMDWGARNIKIMENKIMDYEKEYKEAQERAKKVIMKCRTLSTEANLAVSYALSYVFPATTKENEDEKIRTRLIALVEAFGQGTYKNEMLAYLEKKKEQKPESCDCSRDEESYTNGIHHVLMNPEAYGLIKQKPAEQLGGTFTSYDIAKTFTEGQNYVIAHPEKFGLCKPAEWSKED